MTPRAAMLLTCAVWIVSWIAAASWSSPASARPGFGREWKHHLVTMIGIILLFAANAPGEWFGRRLWSATVQRKADHRVVDTGSYAIVRHPIYDAYAARVPMLVPFIG